MNNPLGVMQGRLLPKYKGRYQAHPKNYWADEFYLAKDIGLDCIEFILDYEDAEENPLLYEAGIKEIISTAASSGVSVKSICADYYMEAPLHSSNEIQVENSLRVLNQLIDNAIMIGVKDIVIPCVDQSSLKLAEDQSRFIESISEVVFHAEKKGVNLALETDLPPKVFINLLENINSNNVTVNYDIGNSASLGYDPIEELETYGDRISDIHIKDRKFNGGPEILGYGDAKFDIFFNKLSEFNYKGIFIMQAYRDNNGIDIFNQQLNWFRKKYA